MSDATARRASGLAVTVLHACSRGGRGGSPTAVVEETALGGAERRRVPVLAGTSHAVFVSTNGGAPGRTDVSLRFFTPAGELPACGHGTVAALAFLAARGGHAELRATVRTPGRVFRGHVAREDGKLEALFEPGAIDLRRPSPEERDSVLRSLGSGPGTTTGDICVASLGRPRMLVPVPTRAAVAALAPDLDALRDVCDRLGLLGCYAYGPPGSDGHLAARMFAPSIGVPEDIANANSTACLAAHLAREGSTGITVDMGDSLGSPSTVTATARQGPDGPLVHVGGTVTAHREVLL
ncbi:PhzF family phenazine biosynthesis protein [Streptomyces sp. NPDC004050]